MRLLHDKVRLAAAKRIETALPKLLAGLPTPPPALPSTQELYDALVLPPKADLGDLAFGCFTLGKALRQAPPKIAAELASLIESDGVVTRAQAAGPYLNLTLSTEIFGSELLTPLQSGAHFQTKLIESAPRTMIEYSQPNTHKELHVGHMRNLCLGNALVRLMRYAGYEIISSTFPGDVGTHVAKCLWYMKYHNTEPVPANNKGEWLGRMYSKGNLKLEDETGTPKEQQNRETLTLILKQLEAKSGEFYELWKETREWSIALMHSVYDWAGVHFDQWYFESDVDSASVQLIKKWYAEGKLTLSEGAVGMDLSEDSLGFMLLLKSDGTGLYATKDIELARRKFDEFKIEKSLYVVDVRQALHFKQVFRALEKLGFSQAKNCVHLQYNFVELPDGAMSSRKGNIVPITALIQQMESMVKKQYLSRYKDEWSQGEIDSVATTVAQGAIKYGMLRMDTNKKIVFDMKEWLRLDGESGPFIQYSYARIASLCRKLNYDETARPEWTQLIHPSERQLMQSLMQFNTIALLAAESQKPATMCTYLYELAKAFNIFYHECPIGTAPTPDLRTARLALSHSVGATLHKGLELLGIPSPQRM